MKTLYETIFDIDKNIDSFNSQLIIDGLLSENESDQTTAIGLIQDLLQNEKRLKTCSKFANSDKDTWFVKLPPYKGYSDDIMFGHRVGSNHWIYRIRYNKTYHDKLFKDVINWKMLSANMSPKNNYIYVAPKNLSAIFSEIEKILLK